MQANGIVTPICLTPLGDNRGGAIPIHLGVTGSGLLELTKFCEVTMAAPVAIGVDAEGFRHVLLRGAIREPPPIWAPFSNAVR